MSKILSVTLAGLLIATQSPARTLVGSFVEGIAPYVFQQDGVVGGIEVDIVRQALHVMDYDIEARPVPNVRLLQTYHDSTIDFVAGLGPDATPELFYSTDFVEYSDYAVTRAASGITLRHLGDLLNYRTVGWQDCFRAIGLDRITEKSRATKFIELVDTRSQIRFFLARRADVLVMDKYIFFWNVRGLAGKAELAEPLIYNDIIAPKIRVGIGFKDRDLRDLFDEGMRRIRANGDYDRIFARYVPAGSSLTKPE